MRSLGDNSVLTVDEEIEQLNRKIRDKIRWYEKICRDECEPFITRILFLERTRNNVRFIIKSEGELNANPRTP